MASANSADHLWSSTLLPPCCFPTGTRPHHMSAIAEFAREALGLRLTPMQGRAVGECEEGHQQAVVRAGRRSGKALDVSTPIPTPTGWTTMGEIQPGDVVYDGAGMAPLVVVAPAG